MKKLLAIMLALALALSLAACGKDEGGKSGRDEPSKSDKEDGDAGKNPFEGLLPDDPNEPDEPEDTAGAPEEPDPFDSEVVERVGALDEDTAEAAGTCGENLTWYYLDGLLVIRGAGEMWDFSKDRGQVPAPWSELAKKIELVYLDDGVTSIGNEAFASMEALRAFYMPDSLTAIRYRAFYYCENLTYVRYSENLTELGSWAFGYTGLQSFSVPRGITKLGTNVLCGSKLISVEIPDNITEIGDGAFAGCGDLTSVTIPDSVTTIAKEAFYRDSFTTITIPASVTFIGAAFTYGDVTTVTFLGDAPEMEEYEGRLIGVKQGATIQYSGDGFEKYIEEYPDYNWVKQ